MKQYKGTNWGIYLGGGGGGQGDLRDPGWDGHCTISTKAKDHLSEALLREQRYLQLSSILPLLLHEYMTVVLLLGSQFFSIISIRCRGSIRSISFIHSIKQIHRITCTIHEILAGCHIAVLFHVFFSHVQIPTTVEVVCEVHQVLTTISRFLSCLSVCLTSTQKKSESNGDQDGGA